MIKRRKKANKSNLENDSQYSKTKKRLEKQDLKLTCRLEKILDKGSEELNQNNDSSSG